MSHIFHISIIIISSLLERINRWWSPSDSYSLILSNSIRPSPGIEYKNYLPIEPKKIFKFLGYVNYEFFCEQA